MEFARTLNIVCRFKNPSKLISRSMFKARNEALVSASYSFMNTFLQDNVLHATTTSTKIAVINAAMHYTKINIPHASLQHKARFVNNVFREKWDVSTLSEVYYENYPENKSVIVFPQIKTTIGVVSTSENRITTDSRVFAEIPVINALIDHFRPSILQVYNTLDQPYKTFANQKQANVDYVFQIKTMDGSSIKETYGDAKSGLHMIRHMTRGHLGVVETHKDKEIEFTSEHPLITTKYNMTRVRNIGNTLDPITKKNLTYVFDNAQAIINNSTNPYEANRKLNSYLWDHIQRNPIYDRSLSFVFQAEVNPLSYNSTKYSAYKKRFIEVLGEQKPHYDLDSIADRKVIFKAMILAFSDVEPSIKYKLSHMKGTIALDQDLILIMNKFIENTLN